VKVFYTASETRLYCRETWKIEEKKKKVFLALTFKKTSVKLRRKKRKEKRKKKKEKRKKKKMRFCQN